VPSWAWRFCRGVRSAASAAPAPSLRGIFQQIANEHGVSPQQVCLAWELTLSPTAIPGASRPDSITDSARAADLELTTQQLHDLSGHRP
jgi:diketogulonate reductase-like aldo/keto reductase